MVESEIVENWLSTLAYSHSGSKKTEKNYRIQFAKFLDFTGKTPEDIVEEYENCSKDRQFKRKYAQVLMSLIRHLQNLGYAPSSVSRAVDVVKSFFKYNELPLGFIPSGSNIQEFHNRDIRREEVLEILKIASLRDRAFFCLMAQSGLRPSTLASLRIEDFEKLLDEDTPIPNQITVWKANTKGKYMDYFSFAGAESIKFIKDYFKTRENLTLEDYVFTKFGHPNEHVSQGVMSHIFRKIVEKLRENDVIQFKTTSKKLAVKTTEDNKKLRDVVRRSELRLYNLRKFFRKYAGQAGHDYVNYWMGHTSSLGVDLAYFSKDGEYHREIYKEKAMPHLRLETVTRSETEKMLEELKDDFEQKLAQKNQDIQELKKENLALKKKLVEVDTRTTMFQKTLAEQFEQMKLIQIFIQQKEKEAREAEKKPDDS